MNKGDNDDEDGENDEELDLQQLDRHSESGGAEDSESQIDQS